MRADLPEKVHVVTKSKLNGQPNTIARAVDNIVRKEQPAYALTDFDTKGMPPEVTERMQQLAALAELGIGAADFKVDGAR